MIPPHSGCARLCKEKQAAAAYVCMYMYIMSSCLSLDRPCVRYTETGQSKAGKKGRLPAAVVFLFGLSCRNGHGREFLKVVCLTIRRLCVVWMPLTRIQ